MMTNKFENINFMGRRKLAGVVSLVVVLVCIASLAIKGLNLGLDFLGGTQLEVSYSESANLEKTRQVLTGEGYLDATVVYFGTETDVMIRFQGSPEDVAIASIRSAAEAVSGSLLELHKRTNEYEAKLEFSNPDAVRAALETIIPSKFYGPARSSINKEGNLDVLLELNLADGALNSLLAALSDAAGSTVEKNYSDSVDSAVGEEMLVGAMQGLLVALLMVMLYVAVRFQFKFALGAVAALGHDVLITLGLFSLFSWEFDLTVFAAVLAVIGYSLNDTIVVSDRIRENFRLVRKATPIETINLSLNQTLGRTLVTSFTTLLVLLALFFFGGEVIHGFAQALIVGILVGTYSSIYVAANIMLVMKISKEDLIVPVKEGAEFDEIP